MGGIRQAFCFLILISSRNHKKTCKRGMKLWLMKRIIIYKLMRFFILVVCCLGVVTSGEKFAVIGDWGYIKRPTNIKKMMKRID